MMLITAQVCLSEREPAFGAVSRSLLLGFGHFLSDSDSALLGDINVGKWHVPGSGVNTAEVQTCHTCAAPPEM